MRGKNLIKIINYLCISLLLMPTKQGYSNNQEFTGFAPGGFGMQKAWENPEQNLGENQKKPGYVKYVWEPGTSIPIRTREGMLTMINLPKWESMKDAYVGDKDFFDGRPISKNTFVVSPVDGRAGADTNLIIIGGSNNKYVFRLTSEPINAETITDSVVDLEVPYVYKNGVQIAGETGVTATGSNGGMSSFFNTAGGGNAFGKTDLELEEDFGWIKSIPVDPTEFRFDMEIFVPNPDDYIIAPDRVWRDKIFTYVDFGEKALTMPARPVPSILIEGGEAPVGFRTEGPNGRLMVLEAIGDFVLRNGTRIVCIKKRDKPYLVSNPNLTTTETKTVLMPANGAQGMMPNPIMMNQGQGIGMQTPGTTGSTNGMMNMQQGLMPAAGVYMNPTQLSPGMMNLPKKAPYPKPNKTKASYLPDHYVPIIKDQKSEVSIELESGTSITDLETKWIELQEVVQEAYPDLLINYQPFYSIETEGIDELGQNPASSNEIYRLRIGPIEDIKKGAKICKELSLYRIPCTVVRSQ